MASSSRKKTVSRERRRSSSTRIRAGTEAGSIAILGSSQSTIAGTMRPLVSLDDVLAARGRIAGRLHRTPMLSSRTLSFKPRGVLNKLATLSDDEKRRGVISISAGNHAQALAYASAVEGIDALVVMWQTASPMKIAAARAYGATIDTEAADIPAAFERLDDLMAA